MERTQKQKELDPITKLHIMYGTIIMIMSITFIVTILTMKSSYKNSVAQGGETSQTESTGSQGMVQGDSTQAAMPQAGAGMPPGGAGGMPPFIKKMVQGYKDALAKNPNDTKALVGLANMYYDSGQYPKAIDYYEKVVKLEPSNTNAQADLGTSYYYMKEYDKAVTNLSESLKKDPSNLNARYNLGIVYKTQGKIKDAKEQWEAMKPYLKTDEEKQKLQTILDNLNKSS